MRKINSNTSKEKMKAYVHSEDKGYFTVICEKGYSVLMKAYELDGSKVGDKGYITWVTDGQSLGFPDWKLDNRVEIDFDKMKENYLSYTQHELII